MRLTPIASVALTFVFLYQCYISINKYLDENIGKALYMSEEDMFILPAITVCPWPNVYAYQNKSGSTDFEYKLKNELVKVEDYLLNLIVNNRYYDPKEAANIGLIQEFLSPSLFPEDDWLPMKCFELKSFSSIATSNLTYIVDTISLTATHPLIQDYFIWAHPENEFFPIKLGFLGMSTLLVPIFGLQDKNLSRLVLYDTTTTFLERMNSDMTFCNEGKLKVKPCLRQFIISQIGCDVYGNGTVCSTNEQIQAYINFYEKINGMSDRAITQLTQCSLSCHTQDYEFAILKESEANLNKEPALELSFISATSKNKAEKDILLYDFNNLVADIGGLLGLLLGASVLGLIDNGENFFRYLMSK